VDAYYLDDLLSPAEGTLRFPGNGIGRESPEENFFALAIRPSGSRECLFRFSNRDRADARSTLDTLNRLSAEAAARLSRDARSKANETQPS
jgi:hypothetical protein